MIALLFSPARRDAEAKAIGAATEAGRQARLATDAGGAAKVAEAQTALAAAKAARQEAREASFTAKTAKGFDALRRADVAVANAEAGVQLAHDNVARNAASAAARAGATPAAAPAAPATPTAPAFAGVVGGGGIAAVQALLAKKTAMEDAHRSLILQQFDMGAQAAMSAEAVEVERQRVLALLEGVNNVLKAYGYKEEPIPDFLRDPKAKPASASKAKPKAPPAAP